MSKEEYRECIIKMINEISDEKQLKRIFLFLHGMFVRIIV